MDLAAILDMPTAPRPRGRIPSRERADHRARQIQVLADRYLRGLKVAEVSKLRDVSERTVRYWIRQAERIDDPAVHTILRAARR